MKNIEDLPASLHLSPELSQKFKAFLSGFGASPDIDRGCYNLNAVETIFPLVFGENATIKTFSNFAELNETTW